MISRRLLCLLLLPCGLALSGCKPDSAPSTKTAVDARHFIHLSARDNRAYDSGQARLLARLIAREKNTSLETLCARGDAGKQADQLRTAIAQRPFALLINPVQALGLETDLQSALTAGIHVIILGEVGADLPCSSRIHADQRELGRLAGEVAVTALTLKSQSEGQPEVTGRIIQIRGDEGTALDAARDEGLNQALKSAPGIILVHDAPGGWTRQGGEERTRDALRLQQSFDAVYAHDDLMGLGASQALGTAREGVLIIGTDGLSGPEGGLTLVGDGSLDATLYQPLLVDFAWILLRRMAEDSAFKPKPSYQLTPRIIRSRDVDDVNRGALPPFPEL